MKIIYSLIALTIWINAAQAQITFQKIYGGTITTEDGMCIQQTTDGGYIIGGYTSGFSWWAPYMIKTNAYGDIEWTKVFDTGLYFDEMQAVIQTSDGGYLLAGWTGDSGSENPLFIKTDALGNVQWSTKVSFNYQVFVYDVIETTDGGYVAVGSNFIKLDASGNIVWSKETGLALAHQVIQTPDGGYAFVGHHSSLNGLGNFDGFLTQANSMGNYQGTTLYGESNEDHFTSVCLMSSGGYLMAGWTKSFGDFNGDGYLVRANSTGQMIWSRIYNLTYLQGFDCMIPTTDGNFVLGGTTYSTASLNDYLLVKTDTFGNILWSKTYGGSDYDYGIEQIDQTADGGFICVGSSSSFSSGSSEDIYVVKTDANGNSGCNETNFNLPTTFATTLSDLFLNPGNPVGVQAALSLTVDTSNIETTLCLITGEDESPNAGIESKESVVVSPNPAGESITVSSESKALEKVLICDVSGKMIREISFPQSQNELTIPVNDLDAGMYLLELVSDEGITVRKFLKD